MIPIDCNESVSVNATTRFDKRVTKFVALALVCALWAAFSFCLSTHASEPNWQQIDQWISDLQSLEPGLRENGAKELIELGEKAVPQLVDFYCSSKMSLAEANAAIKAIEILEKIGKDAVPYLLQQLPLHEKCVHPYKLIIALGKIGDPRAVVPLIKLLDNKELNLRISAASALGQIKDPRAVSPLIHALSDPTTGGARRYVALALGSIGDPSALMAIAEKMRDRNIWDAAYDALGMFDFSSEEVREATLTIFEKEHDLSIRQRITELIGKDVIRNSISIKRNSIPFLSHAGGKEGITRLMEISASDEEDLIRRKEAVTALAWIVANRTKTALGVPLKEATATMDLFGEKLLADPSDIIRNVTIVALERIHGVKFNKFSLDIIPYLIAAAKDPTNTLADRFLAITALGHRAIDSDTLAFLEDKNGDLAELKEAPASWRIDEAIAQIQERMIQERIKEGKKKGFKKNSRIKVR
ncbi:MAG: HEAT repeat domain-containing protein [Deltaproteobacteria bacterium]|nr:HEAT repeat domain-containing protein [Deltaproteobacteria bacterium]